MSNQIGLFDGLGLDINEKTAFECMASSFHDTLERSNILRSNLSYTRHKSYSSVTLASVLVMRFCFRGQTGYVEVPVSCKDLIPTEIPLLSTKAEGFIRLQIESANVFTKHGELWAAVLQNAINRIPKEFDCCGWYLECSQENRCVSPNHDLALGCGYKKILQSGRNFYKIPTKLL